MSRFCKAPVHSSANMKSLETSALQEFPETASDDPGTINKSNRLVCSATSNWLIQIQHQGRLAAVDPKPTVRLTTNAHPSKKYK